MEIVIKRLDGDWNAVAKWVNRWDLADEVISIGPTVGEQTEVALKVRNDKVGYVNDIPTS